MGSPWGTFDFAIDQLSPGDTLFVRGGTYDLTQRIDLQAGDRGTSGNRVNIWAYPGEAPILDFSNNPHPLGSAAGAAFRIGEDADWLHFQGLTVQNSKNWGIYNYGDHSIFERLTLRYNAGDGLGLYGSASNNQVLNSDSYENFDPQNNGEHANGFVAALSLLGPGNVFDGVRAWGNSDDGLDFWEAGNAVTVRNSWAYANGVDLWNVGPAFAGDGSGFKLGRDSGNHTLTNVLAWDNQNQGINSNENGTGVTISNATSYHNGRNWQFPESSSQTTGMHVFRNNISYAGDSSDIFNSSVDDAFNTWNGLQVNAADFVSLDDTMARGPRQADGGLPVSDFLRLASSSNLIDAGTNVGLPFAGLAPDLGAFEHAPIPCDFNSDALCNLADLTKMYADSGYDLVNGVSSLGLEQFDLNADDQVNDLDIAEWLSRAASENGYDSPYLQGDADGLNSALRRCETLASSSTASWPPISNRTAPN